MRRLKVPYKDSYFKSIVEASHNLVQCTDPKGRFVYVNPSWQKHLGFDERSIKQITLFDILDAAFVASFKSMYEKVLNGERFEAVVAVFRDKKGKAMVVEGSLGAVENEHGQPIHIQGVFRDVSEEKRHEEAAMSYKRLLEEKTELQGLLSQTTASFIHTTEATFDEKVNTALEKFCKHVDADRAYVFEYHFDEGICNNVYEWCETEITPEIEHLQGVPLPMMQVWVDKHQVGKSVYIQDVMTLDSYDGVRILLEPQGVKSLISVPMIQDEICYGFIGFDFVRHYHYYTEHEQEALKELSSLFLNMLQRKKLQSKLSYVKANQSALISSMQDLIFVLDHRLIYREVHTPIDDSICPGSVSIIDHHLDEVTLPEPAFSQWCQAVRNTHDTKTPNRITYCIGAGGIDRWFDAHITPIQKSGGVLCVVRDITHQVVHEQRISVQNSLIKSLLDSIPDMIFYKDTKGVYLGCNPAFEAHIGLPAEAIIGKTDYDLYTKEEADHFRSIDGAIMAKRESIHYEETVHYPNDKAIPVVTTKSPYLGPDGELIGIIALCRDVSQQKNAEAHMLHTEKMTALGRLSGGIAHDFNNQLMIMSSFCQLLMESDLEHSAKAHVNKIYEATIHSRSIIKELMAFSKKDRSRDKAMDIHAMIQRIIPLLSHTFDKSIVIDHNLDALNSCILADESLIENAIINLCINAKDAIEDRKDGRITLSTVNYQLLQPKDLIVGSLKPGDYILIKVTDNGCGIEPQNIRQVFEPFFTTKGEKGTGIGLSAVMGTVERHGGGIDLQSEIGMGTTLEIYLPSAVETCEVEPQEMLPQAKRQLTPNLLIIDDEPVICDVLQTFFNQKNYVAVTKCNPLEALEHYKKHHQDLDIILMDVLMPDMNGFELLQCFYEVRPNVKVIFLSGYAEGFQLKDHLKSCVVDFVEKPVDLNHLTKLIEAQL